MAQQVRCQACGRILRVPDHVEEPVLTCPRCLADVANPHWTGTAAPAAQAPPVASTAIREAAAPSQAVTSTRTTCPGCGKPQQPGWRFCPYCEHGLARAAPRRGTASLDRDVRRDTQGAGCGLIGLAILGALGLAAVFFPSLAASSQGTIAPLVPITLTIMVLAAIATGIMFARTRHDPSARGIGRVIFGTLVLAGVLCLVIVAAAIVLFIVCLASHPRFG